MDRTKTRLSHPGVHRPSEAELDRVLVPLGGGAVHPAQRREQRRTTHSSRSAEEPLAHDRGLVQLEYFGRTGGRLRLEHDLVGLAARNVDIHAEKVLLGPHPAPLLKRGAGSEGGAEEVGERLEEGLDVVRHPPPTPKTDAVYSGQREKGVWRGCRGRGMWEEEEEEESRPKWREAFRMVVFARGARAAPAKGGLPSTTVQRSRTTDHSLSPTSLSRDLSRCAERGRLPPGKGGGWGRRGRESRPKWREAFRMGCFCPGG